MKKIKSQAEQELHQEVIRLATVEAPRDWTIAVVKLEVLITVPRQCRVELEYVDSTGHIIWFEAPYPLLQDLGLAALRFHALKPQQGGEESWTRASLTVSPQSVISADFWSAPGMD